MIIPTLICLFALLGVVLFIKSLLETIEEDPATYYLVDETEEIQTPASSTIQKQDISKLSFEQKLSFTAFPILFPLCSFLTVFVSALYIYVERVYHPSNITGFFALAACIFLDFVSFIIIWRDYSNLTEGG